MFLLSRILDFFFPPSRDALHVRALTDDSLLRHLAPTLVGDVTALLPYRERAVGALVRQAKFSGNERAQELLAHALTEYLRDYLGDRLVFEGRPIALVPIPLSKKRFRKRGYNQVDEVLKHVHLEGAVRQTHVLRRTRDTKAQTTLNKVARIHNMEEAFVAQDIDPTYLYIVVDDVLTTGATLRDALRALTEAGAKHVVAVALTH